MKKQKKVLLLSGSPRNGNTNFILQKVYDALETENKELILLKDKNIKFCQGCLFCHYQPSCAIHDDMEKILAKMIAADILIIGTPNYFDNVSGLMKNFIDRCHPLYKHELVQNKKIILIFVGGGKKEGTRKSLNGAFAGFVKYLKLKLLNSYSFQALNSQDLSKQVAEKEITKILKKIND
jgi:multimeric flavodoxin WrbA